jgi:hypothetical protein
VISRELLESVASAVSTTADQAALRRQFPGVPITVCDDDDIPARLAPAHETAFACFYYLLAGEHCAKLSNDAESASGIVVGLLGDD